jgi:hypothetical protein
MIGSPAARDSMEATAVSFRALAACGRSSEANAAAKLTAARHAGRNKLCLCFRLTKQDVMCAPIRQGLTGPRLNAILPIAVPGRSLHQNYLLYQRRLLHTGNTFWENRRTAVIAIA